MAIKVLLDTDIGSDIDDAICLAYLLANPECELLGITTVSGEVAERASLASAICQIAGRTVPIFPGRSKPLLQSQRQTAVPQAARLIRWPHQREFPAGRAVEFMRQTIRSYPGEVVLLAIGPLTNVAALLASDEEIPALLRGFVMMGGAYTKEALDWNAMLDVVATAVTFHTHFRRHQSIGLDVTQQVTLSAEEVKRRFQAPLLQPVLDFASVWFEERDDITFHDPLAAATLFDKEICTFERGEVTVETADPERTGQTVWRPDANGRHEVATAVKPSRFFDHFFTHF